MRLAGRGWLSKMAPRFFLINGSRQPLLDLLLPNRLDPTAEPYVEGTQEARVKQGDALRALGLDHHGFDHIVSKYLPKLVLSPIDGRIHEVFRDDPTWTLLGKRDAAIEALGDNALSGFGDADGAISHWVEYMYNLLVMLSVADFLTVCEKRYAAIRDRASARHGKFKPAALRELRKNLLTLSLDLATVRREVDQFWKSSVWRWEGGATFDYVSTPWAQAQA